MKEDETLPSLESLDQNIRRLNARLNPQPQVKPKGLRFAARLGTDLLAGSIGGGLLGYYLDKWLGTSPFLFILCFFFGSAGGFLTMYRSFKEEENKNP